MPSDHAFYPGAHQDAAGSVDGTAEDISTSGATDAGTASSSSADVSVGTLQNSTNSSNEQAGFYS